jgi:hypothetical protein
MPDYGMKVGADLNNDTDLELKLTSSKNALKVIAWKNATFNTDGSGNGSVTIPHNLGFAPLHLIQRKVTAQWTLLDGSSYTDSFVPLGGHNQWAGAGHVNINAWADDTNLYIESVDGPLSATLNFRYFICVDLTEEFAGSDGVQHLSDYGFKAANPDIDVLTAKEYQLAYSSRYKSLQLYRENQKSETLFLPEMRASFSSPDIEEGAYVDFLHGLGYPPLVLPYFSSNVDLLSPSDSGSIFQAPFDLPSPLGNLLYSVHCFADDERIRVSFWRSSALLSPSPSIDGEWDDETITVKILVFAENLLGEESE